MGERLLEGLGNIVGVDMMQVFQAQVGQGQLLAASQPGKGLRVVAGGGGDGCPAGANDVARMEDGRWEAIFTRLVEQVGFYIALALPVSFQWVARLVFGDRHLDA
jgi:hypothetical protein